jgi:hypothetical protein
MSATATVQETAYPSRMPVGSGNRRRFGRFGRRFFGPSQPEAPQECATKRMYIGETADFTESFESYLRGAETLSSYTLEADDGLVVLSETLTSPFITFSVRADGNSSGTDGFLRIKITATTSLNHVEIRFINFELTASEL